MPEFFAWMATPQGWASLATLALLEVVLGIDNVIFISIVASRLAKEKQAFARRIGLLLALVLRIALLSTLVFLAGLTKPLFTALGHAFSARDLILIGGGFYLLYKATIEIDEMVRPKPHKTSAERKAAEATMTMTIIQIAIVDVIFALDSIITAVGMTNDLPIMITAVMIAVAVMMFATEVVSAFIDRNPTTKMLALSFLLMVGFVLMADGFGFHVDRIYLYVAIAFSVLVEALNIAARKASERISHED